MGGNWLSTHSRPPKPRRQIESVGEDIVPESRPRQALRYRRVERRIFRAPMHQHVQLIGAAYFAGISMRVSGTCCWQPYTSRSSISPEPLGRRIVILNATAASYGRHTKTSSTRIRYAS